MSCEERETRVDNRAYVQKSLADLNLATSYETRVPKCMDDHVHVCDGYCLSNELLLDLDSSIQFSFFEKQLRMLKEFEVIDYSWSPSRTPGHFHVIATTSIALPINWRCHYQAVLGSDLTREMFHLRAIKNKELWPILLIMKIELAATRRIKL